MPKHGTNIEIIKKTLKVAILQSHEIKIYNIYSAFFFYKVVSFAVSFPLKREEIFSMVVFVS